MKRVAETASSLAGLWMGAFGRPQSGHVHGVGLRAFARQLGEDAHAADEEGPDLVDLHGT